MKFSIKEFFSKFDQIRSLLWIWSHLLKKSLIENFIFLCSDTCAILSRISEEMVIIYFYWYIFKITSVFLHKYKKEKN